MSPSRRIAPILPLLLVACLSSQSGSDRSGAPGSTRSIRIDVPEQGSPTLLSLLQMRVRNVDVRRSGTCPEIDFRGRGSIMMPAAPSVYVDGQHASDTCVLEMIAPVDVDYLEVYPMGVSNRAGYFSNSSGLILVFTRNGLD